MSHIIKEELSPPPFLRAFGLLAVLIGFVLALENLVVGSVLLSAGVIAFLPKRVKEIDLKNKVFRKGVRFGEFQSGKWKPFPTNWNYISVFSFKQKSTLKTTVGIAGMSSTNIYTEHQVSLICNKRMKFSLGVGSSLDEAQQLADLCAEYLELDVYVVSHKKKYWRRYPK